MRVIHSIQVKEMKGRADIMKRFLIVLAVIALAILPLTGVTGEQGKITIAIPNDATNEGRALLLLQAQGLITLKEDAGITATVADIAENKLVCWREVFTQK